MLLNQFCLLEPVLLLDVFSAGACAALECVLSAPDCSLSAGACAAAVILDPDDSVIREPLWLSEVLYFVYTSMYNYMLSSRYPKFTS